MTDEGLHKIRHSLAHLLAATVLEKDSDAKLGIGPVIENGFYYDILTSAPISQSDLPKIESAIRSLARKNLDFTHETLPLQNARELFSSQPFKLELITDIEKRGTTSVDESFRSEGENEVSVYRTGHFVDLCQGPHVINTKDLPLDAFKLTNVAGAYWRGNEKNQMLTRIYGVAFSTKKELEEYVKLIAIAAKRDHKILGEKLELFTFSDMVGKGLPLWLPNGAFVRKMLEDYMYQLETENGYQFVITPHIAKENLYRASGHLAHYKDDMYAPIAVDEERFYLKPMNCPHHHMLYIHRPRSYRELPIRFAEFGTIYRYERSGVLSGLTRVRGFTQNDAHIYLSSDQLKSEIVRILKMFRKVYRDFQIMDKDYYFQLSLPDFHNKDKYGDIQNAKRWEFAARACRDALRSFGAKFQEASGEAAFYGPKIDVQMKNVYGKEDTVATVQIDLYMPERFDLAYIDKAGKKQRPIIIHRAIMGSFDRFFAFLLEHYSGAFPLWLAPEQVWVIPIGVAHKKYAKVVWKSLLEKGIRAKLKDQNETIGKKIREGEQQKIPYMLIVGDKETKKKTVALRERAKGDRGSHKLATFLRRIKSEIEMKK